jgi:hypothetical protein
MIDDNRAVLGDEPRRDLFADPRCLLVAYDLLLRNRRVALRAEKTGRRAPALPQSLAILRSAVGQRQKSREECWNAKGVRP